MAIFCLSTSLEDLKNRLGNIVIGYTSDQKPVNAKDLKAHGAMTVLLKDALAPNLVQTLENNPAFVHGGPFANIAHGCNSVIATQSALKLADYVVTEAGFGADLGAEKFLDIKCRKTGLRPAAAVIVATMRALKYHGGVDVKEVSKENLAALEKGLVNLERHVENVTKVYGIPCVVSINRFTFDTQAELELVSNAHEEARRRGGARHALGRRRQGRRRAGEHRRRPVRAALQARRSSTRTPTRSGTRSTRSRRRSTAPARSPPTPRCGRRSRSCRTTATATTRCAWRRPSPRSRTDAAMRGAPSDHVVNVREVRLAAGAEFVVMICGDIMTMPGLPKVPSADKIDLVDGKVVGLF